MDAKESAPSSDNRGDAQQHSNGLHGSYGNTADDPVSASGVLPDTLLDDLAFAHEMAAGLTLPQGKDRASLLAVVPVQQRDDFRERCRKVRESEDFRSQLSVQTRLLDRQTKDAADEQYEAQKRGQLGPSTWERRDPAEMLAAARTPTEPTVGYWSGDAPFGVFYRGYTNSIVGASDTGKSWAALTVAAQELKAGHVVVYVDFEDTDVYTRLLKLGVSEKILLSELFSYVTPGRKLTDIERLAFAESVNLGAATYAVFDGLTEAMSLHGLKGRDENEVAEYHNTVLKPVSAAGDEGTAVTIVDHTPLGDASRAIGSQHKQSAITGVSYLVDVVEPINIDARGCLRLKVIKDRHASVRREAAPAQGTAARWRGDLVVDFTLTPGLAFLRPATKGGVDVDPMWREIWEYAAEHPGTNQKTFEEKITGNAKRIREALDSMTTESYLKHDRGARKMHIYETGNCLPTCTDNRDDAVDDTEAFQGPFSSHLVRQGDDQTAFSDLGEQ